MPDQSDAKPPRKTRATGRKERKDVWQPTPTERIQARTLAGIGHSVRDIAIYFHRDVKTVRRAFEKELPNGRLWYQQRLELSLSGKAYSGNVAAAIFLLKCKFGYRENQRLELTGKDGQPITFSDLSDQAVSELLDALRATLGSAGAGSGHGPEETPGFLTSDLDAAAGTADGGAE